jgi:hypothetical protein
MLICLTFLDWIKIGEQSGTRDRLATGRETHTGTIDFH